MIFWVKYGFENTPLKMYNANVSSSILLSFVRNSCARDIDDVCKHKHIQLGIELDALRKSLQQTRRSLATAGGSAELSATRSPTSSADELESPATPAAPSAGHASSRPASGISRPTTPGATRASARADTSHDESSDEVATTMVQIERLEKQLEVVNTAARHAKELAAGVTRVDLVDQHGAQLHLDEAGATKVSALVTLRQQYSVVAICETDNGEHRVTPLVFKLHG